MVRCTPKACLEPWILHSAHSRASGNPARLLGPRFRGDERIASDAQGRQRSPRGSAISKFGRLPVRNSLAHFRKLCDQLARLLDRPSRALDELLVPLEDSFHSRNFILFVELFFFFPFFIFLIMK